MIKRVLSFGCSHTYGDEMEQEFLFADDIEGHFKKALGRRPPPRLDNGQFDPAHIKPGDASKWKNYIKDAHGWDKINKVCNDNSYVGIIANLLDTEYVNLAKPGNSNTGMYAEFSLYKHELQPDDLVIVAYTGPQRTTQFTLDGKTHTRVNTMVPGMKRDYLDGLTEYILLHSEYGDDMMATILQTYGMLWHIQSVCTKVGCKLIMIDIMDRYVHPPVNYPQLLRIYETVRNFDIKNYLPHDYKDFTRWWALVERMQADYTQLTHTKMGLDVFADVLVAREQITNFKNAWGHYNKNFHERYVQEVILPALKEHHDISI